MSELPALSQELLAVARLASALIMQGYRKRPEAAKKEPRDLVTEFDLRSQELIVSELGRRLPGVAIVAEEGTAPGEPVTGTALIVDPIDGTTNFAHGHPFFAVSIGLFRDGLPSAGAVVAPAIGIEWAGHYDGCRGSLMRNGEPAAVSATTRFDEALIATGFPPNREHAPENNFDSFQRVKRTARAVRRCGSAAIDICFVADGTYDGYWERRLHIWDIAAGAAFVFAGGGRISSLDGGPPRYERGHLIATNGHIHQELVKQVGSEPSQPNS
jgi:myo-inositol-1(or 4)-monophosphatase